MSRSFAFLAIVAVSSVACAAPSEETSGGAPGALSGGTPGRHVDAVEACDGTFYGAAGSQPPSIEMLASWQSCLSAANTAAITTIEATLAKNGSDHGGNVAAAFDAARKSSEALCIEMGKVGPESGGPISRALEAARCGGAEERFLAALVDDLVDFTGTKPTKIRDARSAHGNCYGAYGGPHEDPAVDPTVTGTVETNEMLAKCINGETAFEEAFLAPMEEKNTGGSQGSAADAKARIDARVTTTLDSFNDVCRILSDASDTGTSDASLNTAAYCGVRASEDVNARVYQAYLAWS